MKNKATTFAACFTGILLFGVSMVIIGAMLPLLKEKFGLNDVAAGTLFFLLPFGLLTGSITFGPLSDRYGYRWVLAVSSLFFALGFWSIAGANSLLWLKAGIFVFGIGGGAINGATSALVSDISETKKIANLNLLGIFFCIGAFGMPFLLGFFNKLYYNGIINVLIIISLLLSFIFMVIQYPVSVSKEKVSLKLIPSFLKNKLFLMICFYLFFQSSIEALVNNWAVSYFIQKVGIQQSTALFALSFSVLGMTAMRILTGGIWRNMVYEKQIQFSFALLAAGLFVLAIPLIYPVIPYVSVSGIFLIGAGLASGFPVMLGLVSDMYKTVSATAFSFALFVALSGNMLINYLAGILFQRVGIGMLPLLITGEMFFMLMLFTAIKKNKKEKIQH